MCSECQQYPQIGRRFAENGLTCNSSRAGRVRRHCVPQDELGDGEQVLHASIHHPLDTDLVGLSTCNIS